jgi:spermidine synthase
VLAAIALSGLTALGAEVVWTRLMALLLGQTVYTFSIILGVLLAGLALGSWLGTLRARSATTPARDLAVCLALLTVAIGWASIMLARSLPYWPVVPALGVSPWIDFQLDLVRCAWVITPAALLWGASLPLAFSAASSPGIDPRRAVAVVYAANTLGAITGALLFTFWIVPAFGTGGAQRALVAIAGAAGVLPLAREAWANSPARASAWRGALVLAALVSAVVCVRAVPPIPGALVAYGRTLANRLGTKDVATNAPVPLPALLYVGEGMNESVAVTGNDRVRLFHVSGKTEASTSPKDMRLQRMLGDLPALMHPDPRSVLVVGFGAGVTAGSFVPFTGIRRIVICEIEPLVPRRVAPYFAAENYEVAGDPRVTIVYDDARHFLLTTKEKFDIITSDPIHPWVKGSAALYSQEYFALARAHLNPGGVVSQWLPLYQSSEATIRGEVATFFSAFPGGTLWANDVRGQGYDMVMVGSNRRQSIDLDGLNARLRRPDHAGVVRSLADVGFTSAAGLLACYAGRQEDLAPWLVGAEINRDARLWLQYQAGLETFVEDEAQISRHLSAYRVFPDDLFVGSDELKAAIRETPPEATAGAE